MMTSHQHNCPEFDFYANLHSVQPGLPPHHTSQRSWPSPSDSHVLLNTVAVMVITELRSCVSFKTLSPLEWYLRELTFCQLAFKGVLSFASGKWCVKMQHWLEIIADTLLLFSHPPHTSRERYVWACVIVCIITYMHICAYT